MFKLGLEVDSACIEEMISTVRFILDIEIEGEKEPANKTTFREPLKPFESYQKELKCWQYLSSML